MHFTSPNTNFLTQGALPWTPVNRALPLDPSRGHIGGPLDPTRGFLSFAFDVSPSEQFLKVESPANNRIQVLRLTKLRTIEHGDWNQHRLNLHF